MGQVISPLQYFMSIVPRGEAQVMDLSNIPIWRVSQKRKRERGKKRARNGNGFSSGKKWKLKPKNVHADRGHFQLRRSVGGAAWLGHITLRISGQGELNSIIIIKGASRMAGTQRTALPQRLLPFLKFISQSSSCKDLITFYKVVGKVEASIRF